MTVSLDTLVVAAYVFASILQIPRSGPVWEGTPRRLSAARCGALAAEEDRARCALLSLVTEAAMRSRVYWRRVHVLAAAAVGTD